MKTERNLFLRLAYCGSNYAGWQMQPNECTVQGTLIEALERLFGTGEFELFGSSRTDSGVHALDQWVTFRPSAHPPIPAEAIHKALIGQLPPDIRVKRVEEMPAGFHVRHSNCGKAYTYLLHRGPLQSPFLHNFVWPIRWDLDLEKMKTAAGQLLGEHDFVAFTVALQKQEVSSTVRELNKIIFTEHGKVLAITVVGSSFLYKMVRRIIGFFVDVGRGHLAPELAGELLASGEREDYPFETAPPQGLFLEEVFARPEQLDYVPGALPFLRLIELD